MSDFVFQGKKVHYRLVGEGRPLLMLNGIMMSTKSWAPFEAALTRGGNRLILVDLLDHVQTRSSGHIKPFFGFNEVIIVYFGKSRFVFCSQFCACRSVCFITNN